MANITPADVRNRFITGVMNRSNSSISWGTNNYPGGSNAGWFGGTTAGLSSIPTEAAIGGGAVSASKMANALLENARLLARCRRTRIVIYLQNSSGGSWWNSTYYDGTDIAHLTQGYAVGVAMPPVPGVNTPASIASVDNFVAGLWANLQNARNNTATLTNTICHSSCHSNCHSAGRGRR